jgi:transcription elongation factor Elf1
MSQQFVYQCPHCAESCSIQAQYTGQNIVCPNCQQEFFATAPKVEETLSVPEKLPFFKTGKKKVLRENLKKLIEDGELSADEEESLNQLAEKMSLRREDFDAIRKDLFMEEIGPLKKRMEQNWVATDEDLEIIEALQVKYGVKDLSLSGDFHFFRNIYLMEEKEIPPMPINSSLMLDKNETAVFELQTAWSQARVHRKGYAGASVSLPTGIKGVRFRFGNYQPIASQEITELDRGLLVVTSKRLLFKGNTRNTNVDYSKIIDATIFIDSLKIDKKTGKDDWFTMNAAEARYVSSVIGYYKDH